MLVSNFVFRNVNFPKILILEKYRLFWISNLDPLNWKFSEYTGKFEIFSQFENRC